MSACDHEFKSHFRPDLVMLDEGGRLPELELLSVMAFFDGPFLVVGGPQQMRPFTELQPDAANDAQSFNPFVHQLSYSTLERAADAGAVDAYLTFNHRAYGNLCVLPSNLIYRGIMAPYRASG